jgi:hypothetical protein
VSGMGKGSLARKSEKSKGPATKKRKTSDSTKAAKAAKAAKPAKAPTVQGGTRGRGRGRKGGGAKYAEEDVELDSVPVVKDHQLQNDDDDSGNDSENDSENDEELPDGSGDDSDDDSGDDDSGDDSETDDELPDGSDDDDGALADDDGGPIDMTVSSDEEKTEKSPIKTSKNKKTKDKHKQPDKKKLKQKQKEIANKLAQGKADKKKSQTKEPAAAAVGTLTGTTRRVVVKIGDTIGVPRTHRGYGRRKLPYEFGVVKTIFGNTEVDVTWCVIPFGTHRRVPMLLAVPQDVAEKANEAFLASQNESTDKQNESTDKPKVKPKATKSKANKAAYYPTPSDEKQLQAVQDEYGGSAATLTEKLSAMEKDRKQAIKDHNAKLSGLKADIAEMKVTIEAVSSAESHLSALTGKKENLTDFIVASFGQSFGQIADIFADLFAAVDLVKVAYLDDHDEALLMPTPTIVCCIKAAIKAVAEKEAAMADAVPTDQRATPEDTPTATADDPAVATGPGAVSSANVPPAGMSSADVASVVAPADVLPAGVALAGVAPADIPPATAAGGSVPAHVNVEAAEPTAEDAAHIAATLVAESAAAAAVGDAN